MYYRIYITWYSTLTLIVAKGVVFTATKVGGAFLSLKTLIGFGIGDLLEFGIPLTIHGGFMLYKKLVEKNKLY